MQTHSMAGHNGALLFTATNARALEMCVKYFTHDVVQRRYINTVAARSGATSPITERYACHSWRG